MMRRSVCRVRSVYRVWGVGCCFLSCFVRFCRVFCRVCVVLVFCFFSCGVVVGWFLVLGFDFGFWGFWLGVFCCCVSKFWAIFCRGGVIFLKMPRVMVSVLSRRGFTTGCQPM